MCKQKNVLLAGRNRLKRFFCPWVSYFVFQLSVEPLIPNSLTHWALKYLLTDLVPNAIPFCVLHFQPA